MSVGLRFACCRVRDVSIRCPCSNCSVLPSFVLDFICWAEGGGEERRGGIHWYVDIVHRCRLALQNVGKRNRLVSNFRAPWKGSEIVVAAVCFRGGLQHDESLVRGRAAGKHVLARRQCLIPGHGGRETR